MTQERKLYELWVEKTVGDEEAQRDLRAVAEDDAEISERFYRDLNFGTAGLRGIMGMGINRMNCYVVGRAAQGLAQYLRGLGIARPSAAIAYDSRLCSEQFARHAACVLAANGVKAYIYAELMPTPALSYAVRELGCDAGINITASHNPAAYNGFKAYDSSGCQIGPQVADAVQKSIAQTDIFSQVEYMDFDKGVEQGWIEPIPDSFVEQYLDRVFAEALQPGICAGAGLSMVFTPLNGAGNRCVRAMLGRLGIKDVHIVPEQEKPDGNFPTCSYPNPEIRSALELGLLLCAEKGADILIATDPDADRLGVAVLHGGEYRILSGNELGILLLDYICRTRQKLGKMPREPVAVRSLVSSRMADLVASHYGAEMRAVLTGFKFIGEVIAGLEEQGRADSFIFGFEESCGYLSGGYVRDKDAVNAALLVAEMACECKLEGKTLIDVLDGLYSQFGVWKSDVDNFAFEGAQGMKTMASIMETLRENPPIKIGEDTVGQVFDYGHGEKIAAGAREKTLLPKTDMIEIRLENGNCVIVRPSGTEPKLKIYYAINGSDHESVEAVAAVYRAACAKMIGI